MPEEGHYAVCDKSNIWYHPSCEGLDVNEIQKVVFHIFAKMFKSETNEKKIISLLITIHFLKSEAATTVRSKKDICLLHVSFQFQSKYPSKVSAMKVIDLWGFFLFCFFILQ